MVGSEEPYSLLRLRKLPCGSETRHGIAFLCSDGSDHLGQVSHDCKRCGGRGRVAMVFPSPDHLK